MKQITSSPSSSQLSPSSERRRKKKKKLRVKMKSQPCCLDRYIPQVQLFHTENNLHLRRVETRKRTSDAVSLRTYTRSSKQRYNTNIALPGSSREVSGPWSPQYGKYFYSFKTAPNRLRWLKAVSLFFLTLIL